MHLAKSSLFDAKGFSRRLASGEPPITVFRTALDEARRELHAQHVKGSAAQDVVHGHAWVIDQILHFAWELFAGGLEPGTRVALVAVGGYGRGELHPRSDVDVMLLIERATRADASDFSEKLLRFLWDIRLDVGHSVRTVADCVRESKRDITVATNLMEARLLEGDDELFEQMKQKTQPPRVWPVRKFFQAKLNEQIARHERFDDTEYNLEPNIKEGPGGLRDIQTIAWVAQRHFGATAFKDLIAHDFLTEEEYRTLIRGRNFLWRLRNGLHFLAGRREDRLLFDHQRSLATEFGFEDRENHLAVEQLMKRYYRTVKELRLLNEILLQHFQEAILSRRDRVRREINRRFCSIDGFLEVNHSDVFRRNPFALLEMFLILQQRPEMKGVRASTIRLVRANLHRIDAAFRDDIACRSLFMEIVRQPAGLTHALRRMNAYGVLGAYLPVFGRIVGQMQHDLFHVYTVDAHALFVVRNLRRFAVTEFRHEFPHASEIMGRLFKRERLYLAGLFHDIAKGRGGDHSKLGEADAFSFCKRHDMSDYDAHFVAWLVRHHLLMSWTAQREDISDPNVITRFAQTVGDQEHLDNLYLLTMADIRGTSPQVWNAWKGRLLADLYAAASRALRRGISTPLQVSERIRELKDEARGYLEKLGVSAAAVDRYWDYLDDEYFLRHDPETVAWHTHRIVSAHVIDLPLVAARYHPDIGASQFLVFAPDAENLFSVVTGGFDRLHLNILDARVHGARSGMALLVFVVLGAEAEEIREQESRLRTQILAPVSGRGSRRGTLSRTLRHFPIATNVSFAESLDAQYTIMEVVAQDRPGLLYQVSLALLQCKVRLVSAKITTAGERAEDVFFIVDRDGHPVSSQSQQSCLREHIHEALDETGERDEAMPRRAAS